MPTNADLRKQITDKIIKAIETDQSLPWRKPWSTSKNAGRPTSLATHRPYSGVNPLILQIHAERFNLTSKWWATFRQWDQLRLSVKRRPDDVPPGQWGATIVFYKPISKTRIDEHGEQQDERFFLLRTFTVFNADQVEGAEIFQVGEEPTGSVVPDFAPADELIAATEADIRHGGERAFYDRNGDYIQVPQKGRFNPAGSYYETILHELAHWSEPRLLWEHEKHGYAMGELVAEVSASFLSTELGVPQGESLDNHAAYVQGWLEAMKGDSSFIFKASSQASKVADYLLSFVAQQAIRPEPANVE